MDASREEQQQAQHPQQPMYPPAPGPLVPVTPQSPQVVYVRSGKNAGLAAVLSFFYCGLGQIYNGQLGKGIGMGVAYIISIAAMFIIIGFITTPVLWIWGMVDAYKTAERINREAGLA